MPLTPKPSAEAVTRANMRFVETKTPERTRQLFVRQQTSVINAIRAHMAEFGMRAFDPDPIRGGHYGQRSCEPC